MTSRVLGLVRDQVLAFYFGAGDAMDAYRVGFKIPNLLRDLFAEGAMSVSVGSMMRASETVRSSLLVPSASVTPA